MPLILALLRMQWREVPGTPAVPTKVKITAMRNATHDKTTKAVRPVECVTREFAARNSRPTAIISG